MYYVTGNAVHECKGSMPFSTFPVIMIAVDRTMFVVVDHCCCSTNILRCIRYKGTCSLYASEHFYRSPNELTKSACVAMVPYHAYEIMLLHLHTLLRYATMYMYIFSCHTSMPQFHCSASTSMSCKRFSTGMWKYTSTFYKISHFSNVMHLYLKLLITTCVLSWDQMS